MEFYIRLEKFHKNFFSCVTEILYSDFDKRIRFGEGILLVTHSLAKFNKRFHICEWSPKKNEIQLF